MSKKKHRKEHHEEHMDESWLIPYSDLLTLLLALFIILFAASQVDSKKYEQIMHSLSSAFTGGTGMFEVSSAVPLQRTPFDDSKKKVDETLKQQEQLQKESHDMQELKIKLDQFIQNNGLSTQLETTINSDMLKITIRDQVVFDSGSAVVKPEAQKLAVAITNMLAEYPTYEVEVAGYTDNIPINSAEFESNWDLSARRSLNFMKYLIQEPSVDQSRFRSTGYGEHHSIDTNDTPEGRAKNRRVEVNILRNIKDIPAS
jgi:chemotaxis protein MotB